MTNGISVAYRGTDISNASDYSRSIDSRWKFLEVAFEDEFTVNLPAIAASSDSTKGYEQKIDVIQHNLNRFPFFEASVELIAGTPAQGQSGYGMTQIWGWTPSVCEALSDENTLSIFPTYYYSYGQNAVTLLVKYRIYTLDITEEYQAPSVSMPNANAGNISTGVKILDGTESIDVGDKSPEGFSLDTTMKTLAVHSVHRQYIDGTNNTVSHTVGYPPTYFVVYAPYQPYIDYYEGYNIPYRNGTYCSGAYEAIAIVTATNNSLTFKGIQAVFMGDFVFIILKDPAEVAQ